MGNITAIILAAGESKRLKKNKLTLPYQNKPLIWQVFDLVKKIDFLEYILVISSENAKEIVIPSDIKVLYNNRPELGQAHSVVLGTKEAKGEGYLFFSADQPLLSIDLIGDILDKSKTDNIVFPLKENNEPSNPTFFGKDFREELLSLVGKEGGRIIRDKHPKACISFLPRNPEELLDIDTMEEYERLLDIKV
jgi:molybdenum cofactor cytidylyltransferase